MPASLSGKLVVALSSRALFDLEEENAFFEANDHPAYVKLQIERLDVPAKPGAAFNLVRKLLAFNKPGEEPRVEVVILSRNDPVSGLRVFRSAAASGLDITRGVFTGGRPRFQYLAPLGCSLFLAADAKDIAAALEAGVPAARVYPRRQVEADHYADEVRIAFDGDAVLFSDEAERVYQDKGVVGFHEHEARLASHPLPAGPFKPLLESLHRMQSCQDSGMRIRTALVTARSAPAHERAIRTLMDWNIAVDEALFLGGLDKGVFLREFEPDFFFDDQTRNCESSAQVCPTGQVAR